MGMLKVFFTALSLCCLVLYGFSRENTKNIRVLRKYYVQTQGKHAGLQKVICENFYALMAVM